MSKKTLGAFIITFERPEILQESIKKIFEQSCPPEKILIIDNSISNKTEENFKNLDTRISYHRMGYNSGPAGAAKKGLEIMANEGYKWIFWSDDNDPPPTNDCLEKLICLAESYNGKCGQVGPVGHKFNKLTGIFKRTSNKELLKTKFIEVDSIGGGMCKIINAQTILDGILPDEKLFFGYEELDFDLATKKAGYQLIVHSNLFLECRKKFNRLNYRRVINLKKDEGKIWREYYGIRNSLYILMKNKLYLAFFSTLVITLIKIVLSFKYGWKYGTLITKNAYKAVRDYSLNRFYQREI